MTENTTMKFYLETKYSLYGTSYFLVHRASDGYVYGATTSPYEFLREKLRKDVKFEIIDEIIIMNEKIRVFEGIIHIKPHENLFGNKYPITIDRRRRKKEVKKMTDIKYNLIVMMANEIVKCYDNKGHLEEEYYNDVILNDLTEEEIKNLRQIAKGRMEQ